MGVRILCALWVVGVFLAVPNPTVHAQEVSTTTVTVFIAECTDGIDNDGDLLIDYPSDLGCDGPGDNDETDPVYLCSDTIDNDGDGKIDYPDDPGCDNPTDQTEDNIEPIPLSAGGGTIVGLINLVQIAIQEKVDTPTVPIIPTPARPLYVPDVAISLDPNTLFVGDGTGPTGATRSYFGFVRNADGSPLSEVLVQLFARREDGTLVPIQSTQGGLLANVSNEDGFFKLDPVPRGLYTLVASKVGYADYEADVSNSIKELLVLLKTDHVESAVCLLPFTGSLCAPAAPWLSSDEFRGSTSLPENFRTSLLPTALAVSIILIIVAFLFRFFVM